MRTYIIVAFCMQAFSFLVNLCSAFDPRKHDKGADEIALIIGAAMMLWGAHLLGWL